MTPHLRPALILSLLAALAVSCGPPCRSVSDVRTLELTCDPISPFRGEIHFDSPATFETFLVQECLPAAGADERAAQLSEQVDFTTEAVFVASGSATIGQRCILERRFATCDVCEDGLKIAFDDVETDLSSGCPAAKWTVAVVLPRADLRAALDAAALRESQL